MISHIFSTLAIPSLGFTAQDIAKFVQENALLHDRKVGFHREIEALLRESPTDKAGALRGFLYRDNRIADLSSDELMHIMTLFRGGKNFQDMIDLVDKSKDEYFRSAAITREFYAMACNQVKLYEKTIATVYTLMGEGLANGEVYGALGKAWLMRHEIAAAFLNATPPTVDKARQQYRAHFPNDSAEAKVPDAMHSAMMESMESYREGFIRFFEYYPGINAAYRLIELGDYEDARNVARLVRQCCIRDGGRETLDYWCATSLMEASCVMGASEAEMDQSFRLFASMKNIEPMQIDSTLNSLTRMRDKMSAAGQDVTSFEYALKKISSFKDAAPEGVASDSADIESKIGAVSYNYRGLASNFVGANFVPGNTRFGGQLPDHCVTRTDWKQFDALLKTPLERLLPRAAAQGLPKSLDDIRDPLQFSAIADQIVRRAYNTDGLEMEYLHSPGHKKYDEIVGGLLEMGGVKGRKECDTRTNISTIMALGLGDCRHHGQAKQIMFDAWQKHVITGHLKDAYNALHDGRAADYAHHLDLAEKMERIELRTFDVVVYAPIKMKTKYVPDLLDGKYQSDPEGRMNEVEDHTMTFLIVRNEEGVIDEMRFADSFYQNHYKWGEGKIDRSDIAIDPQGSLVLPGKTIEVVDPASGEVVAKPILLKPTVYAGKRDKIASDENGKLRLLGLSLEDELNLAAELDIKRQPLREKRVNGLHQISAALQEAKKSPIVVAPPLMAGSGG